MSRETKVLGIIFIITIIILIGGIFLLSRGQSDQKVKGVNVLQIDYTKGQKIGSDSAKVKLVEFSDFQCPACKSAEPAIKQVLSAYPDNFQFIYRHFPLFQHKNARGAAYLSEAAGEQGKFWEVHDKIFETQDDWSGLNEADATVFFLSLAEQLQLDEAKAGQAKIEEDIVEGRRLGVNSTPTFFLNGRKLNLQSFNDLGIVVGEEFKK